MLAAPTGGLWAERQLKGQRTDNATIVPKEKVIWHSSHRRQAEYTNHRGRIQPTRPDRSAQKRVRLGFVGLWACR